MTTFWGVDLGVRSYAAAGIAFDGSLTVFTFHQKLRGRVKDQTIWDRVHELVAMGNACKPLPMPGDVALIEEPPLAGSKNLRTYLKLAQASAACGTGMSIGGAETGYVEVSTWKKGTVGNGSASKELVARWLEHNYPDYHVQCAGDQNQVDATCIALYARSLTDAAHDRAALARGLDQTRRDLAVS